jgi:hypothetical protein
MPLPTYASFCSMPRNHPHRKISILDQRIELLPSLPAATKEIKFPTTTTTTTLAKTLVVCFATVFVLAQSLQYVPKQHVDKQTS